MDEVVDDCQPQAQPTGGRVALAAGLHKRLEDSLNLIVLDPAAIVADRHQNAITQPFHRHFDSPAWWGELGSVGQEIPEHLGEADRIAA
jgi:hypothetical protein